MKSIVRSQTGIVHLMIGDVTVCHKMFRRPRSLWSFKEIYEIKNHEFCTSCFKHGRGDANLEMADILKEVN